MNDILYWQFHFENEIPVNRLFFQWKWTCILDFGSCKWNALNVKVVDKLASKLQGQCFFFKVGQDFRSGPENVDFFLGGCPALPVSTSLEKLIGAGLPSGPKYSQHVFIDFSSTHSALCTNPKSLLLLLRDSWARLTLIFTSAQSLNRIKRYVNLDMLGCMMLGFFFFHYITCCAHSWNALKRRLANGDRCF